MVANENKRFAFIMRCLKYFFVPDENQKKPNISPQTAKHKNKIAAFYFSKHRPYNGKWKYEQHDSHKSDECVN